MAIRGHISLPGDKSISHRALMLAALCEGESQISNLSTGADVSYTRRCLKACGVEIRDKAYRVVIKGGSLSDPDSVLNCGNSGTTARLLLGLLAGQGINAKFVGDNSLASRPMERVISPLENMGLETTRNNGTLPISIKRSTLSGIKYELPVPSAQVKSAVILAGLGAQSETAVIEKIPTRNHTELMLQSLGANISFDGNIIRVSSAKPLSGFDMSIPGDPSTAAFFAAATALLPQSELELRGILLNPTRTGFFTALQQMGANIQYLERSETSGEAVGNLKIISAPLRSVRFGRYEIPGLIDEIPVLAVAATQAKGITEVRGAGELRYKECDRINAICYNLKNMGAQIEKFEDGFAIEGPSQLQGTTIKTFGDHRIAMAFSIAGLIAEGETTMDDRNCVAVSYPDFFAKLNGVMA
ncbi:MAG: 3-phosphoshikimate 1-carboxyvinyltransferase [Candidatus Neomarinimicrobiota bacterium]|nr:3-phosphoshikimate 1-carboxyvinyltransferase [Candidatus Neomarinimicrobiota bacterium]